MLYLEVCSRPSRLLIGFSQSLSRRTHEYPPWDHREVIACCEAQQRLSKQDGDPSCPFIEQAS